MGIELLNPDKLFKPDSYHQGAVATGRRMIFMWGQVSQATNGGSVGAGDLVAQAQQACRNVAAALAGAGARFADVVKVTVYAVPSHSPGSARWRSRPGPWPRPSSPGRSSCASAGRRGVDRIGVA
ncbi:MAG: Rid family hydrolase [Rubrivivax sp.]